MLHVGRGKLSVEDFAEVIRRKDNQLADFSAPGHGLFLYRVHFPVSTFEDIRWSRHAAIRSASVIAVSLPHPRGENFLFWRNTRGHYVSRDCEIKLSKKIWQQCTTPYLCNPIRKTRLAKKQKSEEREAEMLTKAKAQVAFLLTKSEKFFAADDEKRLRDWVRKGDEKIWW